MADKKKKARTIQGDAMVLKPSYVMPKRKKVVELPTQIIQADKARSQPKRKKAPKSKWHVEVGRAELKNKGGQGY